MGKCTTRTSCLANEVCVLKVGNEHQSHVADCRDNTPFENDFNTRICCQPTEYCRDGIDNTGDGLIDCASPECHPNIFVNPAPQRCDPDPAMPPGNSQKTSECVVGYTIVNPVTGQTTTHYKDECIGPSSSNPIDTGFLLNPWPVGFPNLYQYPDLNASYYCSYGIEDDGSQTGGEGYCCPSGKRAEQNQITGVWECRDFSPCGMLDSDNCKEADYRLSNPLLQKWLNTSFYGVETDWCVSRIPQYFNPTNSTLRNISSMGCCFVEHYGKYGFYYKGDNVKIFGYD